MVVASNELVLRIATGITPLFATLIAPEPIPGWMSIVTGRSTTVVLDEALFVESILR